MALPSFFKRKKTEDEAPPAPAASPRTGRRGAAKPLPEAASSRTQAPHESAAVTQARIHARRRLIGAAVLLLLGVLLFPLVFETQPRPLRMDLPMVVAPGKAGGAPVAAPVAAPVVAPAPAVTAAATSTSATAAAAATSTGAAPAPPVRPAPPMIIETAEPEPQAAPQTAPQAASRPAALPAAPPAARPASAPARAASKPAATAAAAAAPTSPDASGRFVVQVGAFADDATVRQTRQKVEKLGLKTYTQEVSTDAGKRVRVRVGPFATRDEASQVLNKLKGAGLPGAVLTL